MDLDVKQEELCTKISKITSVSESDVKKILDSLIDLFLKRFKLK